MATIKDVARLSGVSVSTVSIIINNKAEERKISVETQNKVNDVIKKLNYQPSVAAKKLRSNDVDSYTVGIYWASDFRTAYLSRIMAGLQAEMMEAKKSLDIVICPYVAGKLHMEKKLYSTNSFNAIMIANTSEKDNKYIHKNPISIPTVLYNRESDIYHTVGIDNELAGRKAANYFISTGIKTAGIISHRNKYIGMLQRSKGFYDTCIDNNIIIEDKHIIYIDSSVSDGAVAGEILITEGLPDAIFCDSDSIAQGLLYTFNKNKISVPNDVQVISMGMVSSESNAFYTPSITVVDLPMEKLASKCMQIIEDVASHKIVEPCHIIYDTPLILRETTKIV